MDECQLSNASLGQGYLGSLRTQRRRSSCGTGACQIELPTQRFAVTVMLHDNLRILFCTRPWLIQYGIDLLGVTRI